MILERVQAMTFAGPVSNPDVDSLVEFYHQELDGSSATLHDGHGRLHRRRDAHVRLVADHPGPQQHHRPDHVRGPIRTTQSNWSARMSTSRSTPRPPAARDSRRRTTCQFHRREGRSVNHRHGQRGQALFIFVIALVALIAMTGLILDGGAVFAQQRVAQNGADGAATAGTVVIASNLGIPGSTTGRTSGPRSTIRPTTTVSKSWSAIYTDVYGQPIGSDVVNTGAIPANARGVKVSGTRTAATSFARVLGINGLAGQRGRHRHRRSAEPRLCRRRGRLHTPAADVPGSGVQCDSHGELIEGPWIGAPPPDPENVGDEYWPIVGAGDLPSAADPDGNADTHGDPAALQVVVERLRRVRMAGPGHHAFRTSRRKSRAR